MNMSTVLKGLQFVGPAEGDRQQYYVYQGNGAYLVAAANARGGFNVNVVEHEAPDVITRRFKGKHVTGATLKERGRRPDLFGPDFAALNALYVMVALGRARKLQKRDGKALVFAIKR